MATKIGTGVRKLPWTGEKAKPVTLPGTGQTEQPVTLPYYTNGRGDSAVKPVQQPTQGAFAAQPNQAAYQKYLADYTKGLSVSTPEEQAKWQAAAADFNAGGKEWINILNGFNTAGNWNNYIDENGDPRGLLKLDTGRVVGNYYPIFGNSLANDQLPGNPEDYLFTAANGDQWGLDAEWNLQRAGTAAQAAAAAAAREGAVRNDGGLHGAFRGSDGKLYDYDTASAEDLARFGLGRNQATGLVEIIPSGAAAAAAQGYGSRAGNGAGNGGTSSGGYGSFREGAGGASYGGYDYGSGNGKQTAYQRALEAYGYGTAPEWEGTEYERLRDEALRKAGGSEWNYNPSTDPVWQAYQKQYRREGQRATEDTLGRAASMTGGVPSSYAVTAAAQAGNNYAAALSDKLPELYQDSYNRWFNEFQRQLGLADAYAGAGQTEYNRYRDRRDQWNTDRNFQYNLNRDAVSDERYDREWAQKLREYADAQSWKQKDWEQYLREYGDKLSEQERQWAYQQYRDSVSDARYEDETAWNRGKYEDETAYQRELDAWEREYGLGRDAVEDSRYETEYGDERYDTAMKFLQANGYVTGRYAEALGVPPGTTLDQYYSLYGITPSYTGGYDYKGEPSAPPEDKTPEDNGKGAPPPSGLGERGSGTYWSDGLEKSKAASDLQSRIAYGWAQKTLTKQNVMKMVYDAAANGDIEDYEIPFLLHIVGIRLERSEENPNIEGNIRQYTK